MMGGYNYIFFDNFYESKLNFKILVVGFQPVPMAGSISAIKPVCLVHNRFLKINLGKSRAIAGKM